MPIYEYKCLECGKHIEKMQRVSEGPLTVCEECGGKLEKQWSRSGIQFKGEGWYVTDYAAKKSGGGGEEKSSKAESTAKTETASKPDTTSTSMESAAKKD